MVFKNKFFASSYKYVDYAEVPELIPPTEPDGLAILPRALVPNKLVLICHGGGATQASNGDTLGLQRLFLNQGWYVARHLAYSSTNWGNPQSMVAYNNMIDYMKSAYPITSVMILAGSMGNVCASKLMAQRTDITHWFGMEPALNLNQIFNSGTFKAGLKTAFGFSLDTDFSPVVDPHNPLFMDSNSYKGRGKVYLLSSPADTVVPTTQHANYFYNRFNVGGAQITWDNTATGEHGHASHYDQTKILNFFLS